MARGIHDILPEPLGSYRSKYTIIEETYQCFLPHSRYTVTALGNLAIEGSVVDGVMGEGFKNIITWAWCLNNGRRVDLAQG